MKKYVRQCLLLSGLILLVSTYVWAKHPLKAGRVPVILVTDLYHPHQDVGDNFDLLMAYGLPNVELKAVILDCTEPFRKPVATDPGKGLYPDEGGPRDPGFIPVHQLNYIFNRNVPAAVSPFRPMASPQDAMLNLPAFQQTGVRLLLQTLQQATQPVEIVSFGSARTIAVAYNRNPALLRQKVKTIHVSAGGSAPNFLEWNVALDTNAVVCLLQSPLPVAIYPCSAATANAVGYGNMHPSFSYDAHNSFFRLPDNRFFARMNPKLQRYLWYAYERSNRTDYLRVLDDGVLPDSLLQFNSPLYGREHYVWETALWLNVADWVLLQRGNASIMAPRTDRKPSDRVLTNALRPCRVTVAPSGLYSFTLTSASSSKRIYFRDDPYENERALQQALPAFLISIRP